MTVLTHLIDTSTLTDLFARDVSTLIQIEHHDPRALAISAISDFELQAALINPSKRLDNDRALYAFLSQHWRVLPFDSIVAPVAASYRDYIKLSGKIVGHYQLLIGATAKAHNLTLVTRTPDEYQFLPDLTVIDWQTDVSSWFPEKKAARSAVKSAAKQPLHDEVTPA
ncbi:MAG: type II toxin-antitoxin system VapC family toxin [Holosporales bacterium]